MNILIFVMAMIMILGMMTYSKFNQFQSNFLLKVQFEQYMQAIEHKFVNDKNVSLYEETHIPRDSKKQKSNKNTNSSKLPIYSLLSPPSSNDEQEIADYQATKYILKQLIRNLYSQHLFFKEMQNKKLEFVDEIINSLPSAFKNLNPDQKIKRAKDLADLDFKDPELNKIFYKMLKGLEMPQMSGNEALNNGYLPLTNFLDVRKNKKMRPYIMSKNLLEIVFNPSVSSEIIAAREYFFNEITQEKLTENEASNKFEALFENYVNSIVTKNLLDFSVTLTDPKKYR